MNSLELDRDGAERYPGMMADTVSSLVDVFAADGRMVGRRISELGGLEPLVGPGSAICALANKKIGQAARPVRVTAFDKSDGANWALGWHQDRVIAVRSRREVAGFGPWTIKRGLHHVQPPIALLERMVTVRLHLDRVDHQNAPLKIAPGSHRFGRVPEHKIAQFVSRCGEAACLAAAGDAWIYATLVLHASDRAMPGRRRRVVQIDYSADQLPGGLEWLLA